MTNRDPLIEAVATRLRRVEQTGNLTAVLEAGAARDSEALVATVRGDEDDLDALQAAALLGRLAEAPERESASAAVLLCRCIPADLPADHDGRPAMLSGLGAALHLRFAYTGELDDLDGAITATRAVLPAGEQDGASTVQRAMVLDNLHDMLVARFGRSGGLADLDDAIVAARMALDLAPTDDPNRFPRLRAHQAVLSRKAERTGRLADLDAAVAARWAAVGAAPADHPHRSMMLSNPRPRGTQVR